MTSTNGSIENGACFQASFCCWVRMFVPLSGNALSGDLVNTKGLHDD